MSGRKPISKSVRQIAISMSKKEKLKEFQSGCNIEIYNSNKQKFTSTVENGI